MDRRGFFGWVGTLASAWGVSKILPEKKKEATATDDVVKRLVEAVKNPTPGKWPVNYFEHAIRVWKSYGLDKPNSEQTPYEFAQEIVKQWELTGIVYVWKVPNTFGRTMEVWVIPTRQGHIPAAGETYSEAHYRVNTSELPRPLWIGEKQEVPLWVAIPEKNMVRYCAPSKSVKI